MRTHCDIRLFRVSLREHPSEHTVVFIRKIRPVGSRIVEPVERKNVMTLDRLTQDVVTAAFGNAHVEAEVFFVQLDVFVVGKFAQARTTIAFIKRSAHLNNLFAFLRRSDPRKQPCCLGLQSFADNVMTANVMECRNTDTSADTRPAFNEPLGF